MDALRSALVDYRKAEDMLKRTAVCYAFDEPYSFIFLGDTGLDKRKKEIEEIAANAVDLFAYKDDRAYGRQAFPLPINTDPYRIGSFDAWDFRDNGLKVAMVRCSVVRIVAPCICHKKDLHDLGGTLSWNLALELDKITVLYTQDLSRHNYEAYRPTHRQVRIKIFSPEFCCGSIYSEEWLE